MNGARGACLAVVLAAGLGCDSSTEPPSVPPEAPSVHAPEPPPEPPALRDIPPAEEGSARVTRPAWSHGHRAYVHELASVPARFGRAGRVTQIRLGQEGRDSLMLTFYGAPPTPGGRPVLPATDETRAEHAGKDSKIWILSVSMPGEDELRSQSGTVTITEADSRVIAGRFDIAATSRSRGADTPVRAHFRALRDDYMNALLDHEAAIREQLRKRR